MQSCTRWLSAAVVAISVFAATSASAAPVTYYLDAGEITSIQLVDVFNPSNPTICPIGSGNCLVNAPLQLTSAAVTIDLDTGELLDLSIFVSGPGIIDMNGLNGYEAIVFNGTSFQSSGGTTLTPSGSQYNFASPGVVTADTVQIYLLGNPGPYPSAPPDAEVPYVNPTTPTGNIQFVDGEAVLTLTGVDLGLFSDPFGGNPLLAKADFTFTAAIPEPASTALYGVGLLLAAVAIRRFSPGVSKVDRFFAFVQNALIRKRKSWT
jgi:hypothetical protein